MPNTFMVYQEINSCILFDLGSTGNKVSGKNYLLQEVRLLVFCFDENY